MRRLEIYPLWTVVLFPSPRTEIVGESVALLIVPDIAAVPTDVPSFQNVKVPLKVWIFLLTQHVF